MELNFNGTDADLHEYWLLFGSVIQKNTHFQNRFRNSIIPPSYGGWELRNQTKAEPRNRK
jgi:hypothetical protein